MTPIIDESLSPPPTTASAEQPEIASSIIGRVSLRTLILIRWIAIAGQLTAVLCVQMVFGFALPLWPLVATIGASVLLNLAALTQRGSRPRLGDRDAGLYLGYDTLQLAVLLYLTGGLQNPFCILLLAPLTVAATILSRNSVIVLTALTLACLTGLAVAHLPLPWPGAPLDLPPLYSFGVWFALSVSSVFIAAYVWSVAQEARRISDALGASQMALAREQRLSALGALAAAAAHELGTPLGTIAVVAKELVRDVPPDSPLAEDVALLQSQAQRCREILAELARKPEAEGGEPYDRLSLGALVEEAAAPHRRPDIHLDIRTSSVATAEPVIRRSPEIIHGLGNLLQNAIQFAQHRVIVEASWNTEVVTVSVSDDGPGFPPGLLARLGEPYLSVRAERGSHMGLGIFIAQTLLERTGASVSFGNRRSGGALVVVRWRRHILNGSA